MQDELASEYELDILLDTLHEASNRSQPEWLYQSLDDSIEIVLDMKTRLARKTSEQIEEA